MRALGLALALCLAVAAPARADIAIAFAGPVTGGAANFGEQMRLGAELAVKAINAQGGVLGQPLTLVLGDDACEPKQGVAVAHDLVSRDVVFVAGHFCSSASMAAAPVYAEAGVVMISPASTAPKLTESGWSNVFRVCGRDDQQGAAAADYLVRHHGGKRIALIHDKRSYSRGLVESVKAHLETRGTKPAMIDGINHGEKDQSALVSKLKAQQIDVLYFGGYHPEAALILRQGAEQGYRPVFMGADALLSDEFPAISGGASDGALMTFPPDPSALPSAAAVIAAFAAQGRKPEGYALYTYAAIQTWAQAAEAAGSTSAAKVEKALRQGSFETVVGAVAFDTKGDVKAPGYRVYRWQGTTYSPVD